MNCFCIALILHLSICPACIAYLTLRIVDTWISTANGCKGSVVFLWNECQSFEPNKLVRVNKWRKIRKSTLFSGVPFGIFDKATCLFSRLTTSPIALITRLSMLCTTAMNLRGLSEWAGNSDGFDCRNTATYRYRHRKGVPDTTTRARPNISNLNRTPVSSLRICR